MIGGFFAVTRLCAPDRTFGGMAELMFGVVPKTLWAKTQARRMIRTALSVAGFNCLASRRLAGQPILIDRMAAVYPCIDPRAAGAACACPSRRIWGEGEALSSHGFDPESFDLVINTHLH